MPGAPSFSAMEGCAVLGIAYRVGIETWVVVVSGAISMCAGLLPVRSLEAGLDASPGIRMDRGRKVVSADSSRYHYHQISSREVGQAGLGECRDRFFALIRNVFKWKSSVGVAEGVIMGSLFVFREMGMRWMIAGMAFLLLGRSVPAQGQDEVRLFDFEKADDLAVWNRSAKIEISDEWSSSGSHSVKITFPKYVGGKTARFPGMTCAKDKIPVRDWTQWSYYVFDVMYSQDETYLGCIMQRSSARADKGDVRWTLAAGEYRIWLNIPELLGKSYGSEKVREDYSNMFLLEFFQSAPKAQKVAFIDNIRLTNQGPEEERAERLAGQAGVLLEKLSEKTEALKSSTTFLDYVQPMSTDPEKVKLIERDHAVKLLRRELELLAARTSRSQAIDRDFAETGYGVYVAPIEEHVYFDNQPVSDSWSKTLELHMLKGERRSKQIVVFPEPGQELRDIRMVSGALSVNNQGNYEIPADDITIEQVGYVQIPVTERLTPYDALPGWYPDPVLRFEGSFDVVAPREVQPLLLTVHVPRETPAGLYTGSVVLSPKDNPETTVPVQVKVYDAELPRSPILPQLFHGGDQKDADFFLRYRLNPNFGDAGSIYRWGSPIDIEKVENLVQNGMNAFNLLRMSHGNISSRCSKQGDDEGCESFVSYVKGLYPESFMETLQAKGLSSKAVFYGFDEVRSDNPTIYNRIKRVCQGLKDTYGEYGVKTATTAHGWDRPENWELPMDIWIPVLKHYDFATAELVRSKGKEVWWYHVSWDIHWPGSWTKALHWASYANRVQGYLYYHVRHWRYLGRQTLGTDPLTSWDVTSDGNRCALGIGAVIYDDENGTPRPSLRLVSFREGTADYDLLKMLEAQIDRLDGYEAQLPDDQQIMLRKARDFCKTPDWKGVVDDLVVWNEHDLARQVTELMNQGHVQCLEWLELLQRIDTSK